MVTELLYVGHMNSRTLQIKPLTMLSLNSLKMRQIMAIGC